MSNTPSTDPNLEFENRNAQMITGMAADSNLKSAAKCFFDAANNHEYSYHFKWLGRPVIQYPQDMIATQEIIWEVKPDLIIETGVAHGGSLVFSASMLEMIGGPGQVVGIDIDIRTHNRAAIESHPLYKRIQLIEGSSVSECVINEVRCIAKKSKRTLVILDSNHTHEHVLKELELYSPFVSKGSYLIVFDTVIEHMPADSFPNRAWGIGNNPLTAVNEFLSQNLRFEDSKVDEKLLLTVAPGGYLKCIADDSSNE